MGKLLLLLLLVDADAGVHTSPEPPFVSDELGSESS
jgi:hypothetical protein